jgi:hypothetical protein
MYQIHSKKLVGDCHNDNTNTHRLAVFSTNTVIHHKMVRIVGEIYI